MQMNSYKSRQVRRSRPGVKGNLAERASGRAIANYAIVRKSVYVMHFKFEISNQPFDSLLNLSYVEKQAYRVMTNLRNFYRAYRTCPQLKATLLRVLWLSLIIDS